MKPRPRDFVALEASDQKWLWRDIRDTSNQAMAPVRGSPPVRDAPGISGAQAELHDRIGRSPGLRQAGSGREARSLSSDPDRPCGGPRAYYRCGICAGFVEARISNAYSGAS
jgi:hypothetical protein